MTVTRGGVVELAAPVGGDGFIDAAPDRESDEPSTGAATRNQSDSKAAGPHRVS
jgi:hypothetical protein